MSITAYAGKFADDVRALTGELIKTLHAVQRMIDQCEDDDRRILDCTQRITCCIESRTDNVLAALASIRVDDAVRPTKREATVPCEATLSASSAAPSLEYLNERCAMVRLSETLPEQDAIYLLVSMTNSTALQELTIADCEGSCAVGDALARLCCSLPQLRVLKLTGITYGHRSPALRCFVSSIGKLIHLHELEVTGTGDDQFECEFAGRLIAALSSLESLRALDVDIVCGYFDGDAMSTSLRTMPNLCRLRMRRSRFHEFETFMNFTRAVCEAPAMRSLDISGCDFPLERDFSLAALANLHELIMPNLKLDADGAGLLCAALTALPALTSLDVSWLVADAAVSDSSSDADSDGSDRSSGHHDVIVALALSLRSLCALQSLILRDTRFTLGSMCALTRAFYDLPVLSVLDVTDSIAGWECADVFLCWKKITSARIISNFTFRYAVEDCSDWAWASDAMPKARSIMCKMSASYAGGPLGKTGGGIPHAIVLTPSEKGHGVGWTCFVPDRERRWVDALGDEYVSTFEWGRAVNSRQ